MPEPTTRSIVGGVCAINAALFTFVSSLFLTGYERLALTIALLAALMMAVVAIGAFGPEPKS